MDQALALRTLSEIMNWVDERARDEFAWLRLMARLKYDGYRDFQAGARFLESLITWLQQFEPSKRDEAYKFVRTTLVYVSPAEMQRLVELFFPTEVRSRLFKKISEQRGQPFFRLLADPSAQTDLNVLRRKTLFMALSDGARIDVLRQFNVGILNNEQFVVATQVDLEKWRDLLKKLRRDLQDESAKFAMIYLVDDFTGTGTSFIKKDEQGKWSGKLLRFKESLSSVLKELNAPIFEDGWELCVHHYIASEAASKAIEQRVSEAKDALASSFWASKINFSFGLVLPKDLPIDSTTGRFDTFINFTNEYYDPTIENEHTEMGGKKHLGLGFGGCALPLILDHNTPNNSVALLWAETEGVPRDGAAKPHRMRPLFRRRQRHS